MVSANILAMIQKKLPPTCEDLDMFNIPCEINLSHIEHAMLDLGTSINVMSLSIYKELNLGPLKKTKVVIQLAYRSNVLPEVILEDFLVTLNDLMFFCRFLHPQYREDKCP